jgi:hypothetical protein
MASTTSTSRRTGFQTTLVLFLHHFSFDDTNYFNCCSTLGNLDDIQRIYFYKVRKRLVLLVSFANYLFPFYLVALHQQYDER